MSRNDGKPYKFYSGESRRVTTYADIYIAPSWYLTDPVDARQYFYWRDKSAHTKQTGRLIEFAVEQDATFVVINDITKKNVKPTVNQADERSHTIPIMTMEELLKSDEQRSVVLDHGLYDRVATVGLMQGVKEILQRFNVLFPIDNVIDWRPQESIPEDYYAG